MINPCKPELQVRQEETLYKRAYEQEHSICKELDFVANILNKKVVIFFE